MSIKSYLVSAFGEGNISPAVSKDMEDAKKLANSGKDVRGDLRAMAQKMGLNPSEGEIDQAIAFFKGGK